MTNTPTRRRKTGLPPMNVRDLPSIGEAIKEQKEDILPTKYQRGIYHI